MNARANTAYGGAGKFPSAARLKHPEMAIVTDQEVAMAIEQSGKSTLRLLSIANINEIEKLQNSESGLQNSE